MFSQEKLCIFISKNPDKEPPTLACGAPHPHIQRSRQCTNFGKMNSTPAYKKKKEQNTNFGRMSSASSYPKIRRKYQHCQNELCIFISKNPDKVPTLARGAMHRHIEKPRQSTKFGTMSFASTYPKISDKVYNFSRMSSASSYPKTQTKFQLWQDELCILVSKTQTKYKLWQDVLCILIFKYLDKVPYLAR